MKPLTEPVFEEAALTWLESLGYAVLHRPAIPAFEPGAKRGGPYYRKVLLEMRMWVSEKRIGNE